MPGVFVGWWGSKRMWVHSRTASGSNHTPAPGFQEGRRDGTEVMFTGRCQEQRERVF